MFKYQITLGGHYTSIKLPLIDALFKQVDELGLDRDLLEVIDEDKIDTIDAKAPLVAIFVGYNGASDIDHLYLAKLLHTSVTIIPCVTTVENASAELPPCIHHINAFPVSGTTAQIGRLVTLILENLRLLRSERRLFISYRRKESQSVAIQLYESLDAAGFDVFLDTRSVPYAADFQGILWHRMADSDVVVLLDTPGFRESRWTKEELAQANTTNIQILHLLWPKVKTDPSSALSEFVLLQKSCFKGRRRLGERARLTDRATATIVARAESLRARALAARYRSLVDNFCDRARDEHVSSVAVQPQRFISIELSAGRKVAVVPTIGIPRADRYQDIERSIRASGATKDSIWLLYDESGILEDWLRHIAWLNDHLPVIAVPISKCADQLKAGA